MAGSRGPTRLYTGTAWTDTTPMLVWTWAVHHPNSISMERRTAHEHLHRAAAPEHVVVLHKQTGDPT